MELQYFKLIIANKVAHLAFNRPEKANALHVAAWEEMKSTFEYLGDNSEVRAVVLSGEGGHFCAGMDLETLMTMPGAELKCEGKKREAIRKFIFKIQDCITAIERCSKPVLAAIHSGCIGGGVDIVTACDMRFATEDAYFTVKEVDLGLVADIGTLQRLPTIVQPGIAAEMAYTGRKVFGPEAAQIGLVNRTYPTKEAMLEDVLALASTIATKSPLVLRGIKETLLYKRDHSVVDSLNQIATYNAGHLLSDDLMESFKAFMEKRQADYIG